MNLDLGDTRLIIDECARERLSKQQAAYVLATAYWETAKTMKPVREAFWKDEEYRRRKLRYYPYYGRGYVQLTWADNYARAGKVFGVDLVKNPDKALDPNIAVKTLVTGSKEGWFTGKKLGDFLTEIKTDYRGARRVINGNDKAATIAGLAEKYEAALTHYKPGRATYTVLKNPNKTNPLTALINAILQILKALGITK